MHLDPEQLRHAMRAWTTGVAIVTVEHEGQRSGMTVNSFNSISLDPPLISVALKNSTRTYDLVTKANEFSVTILSSNQRELSDRFAGRLPNVQDRFEGVEIENLSNPAPLIKGGMAFFNCHVKDAFLVGENTLFVAEVIDVRGEGEGDPLVYHNRGYWKLA